MAKIAPSSRSPVVFEVPSTPQPVTTQAPTAAPSLPNMNESFSDSKQKLLSLGRTNKTPALMRGTPPAGSFQIKNAALAGGATKANNADVQAAVKRILNDKASTSPSYAFAFALDKLSGDQQVAVLKALPAGMRAQIAQEVAKNPEGYNTGVSLAVVRAMSPKELSAAVETMRAAGGKQATAFELSVASELAARTSWGKDPANAKVVAQMRDGIAGTTLHFGKTKANAAAETSDTSITFNKSLAVSPEQLAATMAHEATHAENFAEGKNLNKLSEENSGVDTELAVFKELKANNKNTMSSLPADAAKRYDDYAKTGSLAGQHARTAGMYAEEAETLFKAGNAYGRTQTSEIVTQLGKEPDAVKALTQTEVRQLADAVNTTGASMKDFGAMLKNASPEMQKEARSFLRDLPDKLAELNAGMK